MTKVLVWLWSHGGGGSEFALNLAQRLRRDFGDANVALSMNAADPVAQTAADAGLTVHSADIVSHRSRAFSSLLGLPKASAIIEEHASDADVVVAAMNFATLAPLSLKLKKPLVYCAHDPTPHAGDYAQIGQRASQAILLKRANVVVGLSGYASEQLRGMGARTVRTEPLQSVFRPAPLSRSASGPRRFLFAGRMMAYKGASLLADALDLIRARNDWRLTIAGDGPAMSDELRKRFNHTQIETLRTEFISRQDLSKYYAASDVLLAPYFDASQSGVVCEALAHGVPCLVTPVGALPEQIGGGEAGWVSAGLTPEHVAAKMIEAIEGDITAKAEAAARIAAAAWESDGWRWLAAPGAY